MPLDLTRIQGILFDIDGTLSNTDEVWTERLMRPLRLIRFLFNRGDVRPVARWLVMASETPLNVVLRGLDILSLDAHFARAYEWMLRHRKGPSRPFRLTDHAIELLERLVKQYPCAVVSARDEYTTLQFIRQFSLVHFFQTVITSQTCEHTKPFADPVLEAAARLGLKSEHCVMVGDTTVDILAGKAAGAQTVGLLCGFGTERELRKAGADLIVRDLQELDTVFQGLPRFISSNS